MHFGVAILRPAWNLGDPQTALARSAARQERRRSRAAAPRCPADPSERCCVSAASVVVQQSCSSPCSIHCLLWQILDHPWLDFDAILALHPIKPDHQNRCFRPGRTTGGGFGSSALRQLSIAGYGQFRHMLSRRFRRTEPYNLASKKNLMAKPITIKHFRANGRFR